MIIQSAASPRCVVETAAPGMRYETVTLRLPQVAWQECHTIFWNKRDINLLRRVQEILYSLHVADAEEHSGLATLWMASRDLVKLSNQVARPPEASVSAKDCLCPSHLSHRPGRQLIGRFAYAPSVDD